MTRAPSFADWHQSLGPGARRREALAWTGAALSVALLATATAALAMRLDDAPGGEADTESVVFLDLTPEPPPPAAAALPDFAPEQPMTDLPEAAEPAPLPEAAPDLAPPPPDTRPPTELAQLPDMTLPPDSFTPPPPPPAPEPEVEPEPERQPDPQITQIPAIRPQPRPEPKPEPKPDRAPEPERDPRRETAQSAPRPQQQASPASPTRAQGEAALPQGRLDDLAATWGNKIRSKIQRRAVAPRGTEAAAQRVEIRVVVRTDGRLAGAELVTSSGNAALDAAATKAVQASGRFPSAPRQLTEASYSFLVPIRFTAAKSRG